MNGSTIPGLASTGHTMALNVIEIAALTRAQQGTEICYIYGQVDYVDIFKK